MIKHGLRIKKKHRIKSKHAFRGLSSQILFWIIRGGSLHGSGEPGINDRIFGKYRSWTIYYAPKKKCSSKQPTVKAPSRDACTLNHLVQIQFTHEPQVLPGRFVHACLPHGHRVTNICGEVKSSLLQFVCPDPLIAATSCLHH